MEVVALNVCRGGTGLAMGTAPWGLGMRQHLSCLDTTLVLLAQLPWEPGHRAVAVAHSPGVGEEGLPPPALCTPVSQDATMLPLCPEAAPPPSHPQLHPAQMGDGCPCQLELIP